MRHAHTHSLITCAPVLFCVTSALLPFRAIVTGPVWAVTFLFFFCFSHRVFLFATNNGRRIERTGFSISFRGSVCVCCQDAVAFRSTVFRTTCSFTLIVWSLCAAKKFCRFTVQSSGMRKLFIASYLMAL